MIIDRFLSTKPVASAANLCNSTSHKLRSVTFHLKNTSASHGPNVVGAYPLYPYITFDGIYPPAKKEHVARQPGISVHVYTICAVLRTSFLQHTARAPCI